MSERKSTRLHIRASQRARELRVPRQARVKRSASCLAHVDSSEQRAAVRLFHRIRTGGTVAQASSLLSWLDRRRSRARGRSVCRRVGPWGPCQSGNPRAWCSPYPAGPPAPTASSSS
eukprot:3089845-Rhodomonas_salina.1